MMLALMAQTANPLIPNQWEYTVLGLGVLTLLLFVVAIIDIARSRHLSGLARAVWVLIALAFPLVGAALWFAIGRRDNARNRTPDHTATIS
jgi:threonine/homoserine/homoserine lactone efflux protein